MSRALDGLREEIRGLRPRVECLAGAAATEEVERCRVTCAALVKQLHEAVGQVASEEQPSTAGSMEVTRT